MSIRNLEYLFKPKSIAVIGASKRPSSVGAVLAKNLFGSGFDGPVMPVNPKHRAIEGVLTYPDIASLPVVPDLAVIATPPDTVPGIIAELGERGTRGAVVITAGFAESVQERGRELQEALLKAAKPYLLRIIGPNCLGITVPGVGLNASFSHIVPGPGPLAFVAQSGAIVTSVLDWSHGRGVGFSHLVSLGDMVDVDFGDMLDYLANDTRTRAILLYIEAVTSARKFMSAARAASRMKPVIVVKAGRYAEGARAAASHTGALTGSDAVYDAVFRRAGMLRVFSLEELFDAVEILGLRTSPRGDRLAILTNGGGIGVLATEALIEEGGRLAPLAPETMARLSEVLPPTWPHGNPVDIIGDAPGSRYGKALSVLMEDRGVDCILVLNCPSAVTSRTEAAQEVIKSVGSRQRVTLLTSWVGGGTAGDARRLFVRHGIPTYDTPKQAIRAFMYMVNYQRSQKLLMQTPPSVREDLSPEPLRARGAVSQALREGRVWLTPVEVSEVLSAYGIPAVAGRMAGTPEEAASIAAQIDGPVALKIHSPEIVHKSDVGGVALDLAGPAAVRETAAAMLRRLTRGQPEAHITGFTLQPMIHREGAYELIVGVNEDPQFGPVILFGHGGTAVEVVNDRALGLPPLNMHLARELMSRTRIYRLLRGFRSLPAADLDAIALCLIRISQLVIDIGEITELDINPLLADEKGIIALDARIRVADSAGPAADRLAIRPYPKELEELIPLGDGRTLLLRPIRPEDEPSLSSAFTQLTPEEIRLRFFVPVKALSPVMAARFTQIDYDREMALILTEPGIPGKTEIFGVVRLNADPDNERAEYAVIVRSDMTGLGLGVLLMRRIIDYARSRGTAEIYGDVLSDNQTMLKLCRVLGFTQTPIQGESGVLRVTLELS